ncbi:MAG: VOC family protein [Pseudomonadota bacterium]
MTKTDYGLDITRVVLAVNDLDRVSAFYKSTVGLSVLLQDGEHVVLGAENTPLLELQRDAHATRQANAPGLYHTAFLLPNRSDLAAWVDMAGKQNVYAEGASDHQVSEAIYLTDPEGNGVEIYADKPQDQWARKDGELALASRGINFDNLMRIATHWNGAPSGTKIGHVHLQVGDLSDADPVFLQTMGLNLMKDMGNAHFYSAGGYHHHFAANTFRSQWRGKPKKPATGLRRIDVELASKADLPSQIEAPWGTIIGLHKRAALAA